MENKIYNFKAIIKPSDHGGAYVIVPIDIRLEFGRGRIKVHATFEGVPYDGSIVNMGLKNDDGSICYILGIRQDIRAKINKQIGDEIEVSIVVVS
jgi:hypothetical protein